VPLLDQESTWQKFSQANSWVKQFLANYDFGEAKDSSLIMQTSSASDLWRRWGEWCGRGWWGNQLENVLTWLQRQKMKRHPFGQRPAETSVVINQHMLKFHETDRREEYRRQWLEILNKIDHEAS